MMQLLPKDYLSKIKLIIQDRSVCFKAQQFYSFEVAVASECVEEFVLGGSITCNVTVVYLKRTNYCISDPCYRKNGTKQKISKNIETSAT